MDQHVKPAPHQIRLARAENPKMRERDLAAQLGITEADFVAAHCGEGVRRIDVRVNDVLAGLQAVGEVMALTRNESAVHEKIGPYENVEPGKFATVVLGKQIDLRVFPNAWAHGFAVEKRDGDDIRRSLQFFDAAGEAVHKVHLRPASDVAAYESLVAGMLSSDQSSAVDVAPIATQKPAPEEGAGVQELRTSWSQLTDTHEFFGMLRKLKLDRLKALHMVGDDYAWQLGVGGVETMFNEAAASGTSIMCFVGNRGCIQIHCGPVKNIKTMGPWINVLDETFHLHLRMDHIRELWGVRKPTKDGHVTSLEAYDAAGELIIQFFGERHEGEAELDGWRSLAEQLPRVDIQTAA